MRKNLTDLIRGLKVTDRDYPDLRWCPRCKDRSVLNGKCLKCKQKFQRCIVCVDGVMQDGRCTVCKTEEKKRDENKDAGARP